jgi:putative hydrolase of the HAD superfamily
VKDCFRQIFSCVSHFNRVKKDASIYTEICRQMVIQPQEMCHVGDHYEFDYEVPASLGIRAYFMDRTGSSGKDGPFKVRDLKEFEARLLLSREA